jgi:hypothetical protein
VLQALHEVIGMAERFMLLKVIGMAERFMLLKVIGMAARAGMHRCAIARKNIPAQTARLMFWLNVQLISS